MTLRRPSARGFTLVELMVAMTVTVIVIGLVFATVQAQQAAFHDGQRQRNAQGSARSALLYIQQELVLAGYGMDAPLAFDLGRYAGPCPAAMGGCARDRTDSADELVFYHRNPLYWVPDDYATDPRGRAWRIVTVDGLSNTVTVSARAGDQILKGQVIQAVCRTGARYAYFTVLDTATAAAAGNLAITLEPAVAADPFHQQTAAADACFSSGQARLFLIDRFRFHVRPVQEGGSWYPYLVLDRGVDTNLDKRVDERDEVLVADGIETIQFGYVLTNGNLAVRGETPGTAITLTPGWPGLATSGQTLTTLQFPGLVQSGQTVYTPTSFYSYTVGPPAAAQRNTDHQANIRAIRVALRARSPEPDPDAIGAVEVLAPVLNQNAFPAWTRGEGRYGRSTHITTVALRNMTVRGMTDY